MNKNINENDPFEEMILEEYRKLSVYELDEKINYSLDQIKRLKKDIKRYKKVLTEKGDPVLLLSRYPVQKGDYPLLGLHNNVIYHPTAYCHLKQCYLLSSDIKEKECIHKSCKYLDYLTKNEQKKGIKTVRMKLFRQHNEIPEIDDNTEYFNGLL